MLPLENLAWFVGCLALFLFIQRWLHRELQAIFLLLTHSPAMSVGLFSLLFFPGVLLHELSHFMAARLVRVRTGRFSVIPAVLPNGVLRMGYVETAQTDILRDALIGTAPIITGALVTGWLGIHRLGFGALAEQVLDSRWNGFWQSVPGLLQQTDFWIWFYLAFAISSTMLPSSSDRRAWLPLISGLAIVLLVAALAGAGPWMLENLSPGFGRFLQVLTLVFALSLVLHLTLLLPAYFFRSVISKVTGMQVVRS